MNNDVGLEGLNAIKKRLKKYGLQPILEIPYNPLETDYSAQTVEILNKNPQSIVIYGFITDTIRWIKTIKDYGIDSQIVTIYPNADPNFIKMGGKYVEGVIITGWVPLPTPDKPEYVKDFETYVNIFQKTYPNQIPSSYAAAGFIAAEVFVEGLARAGVNLTREKLVEALESFNHWNGILAKDIAEQSILDLDINEKEKFELRTKLKMDLLKSHLKNDIGEDYEYKVKTSLLEYLPYFKNKIKQVASESEQTSE